MLWFAGLFLTIFFFCSPNMLLSGSRDKNLIIWNLTRNEEAYGYPKRSLQGHSHIVSDCVCCLFLSVMNASGGDQKLTGLGDLLRRCLRPLLVVGQVSPSVGAVQRCYHPYLRRPQQRRPLRLVLRRQPSDRFGFS